MKLMDWWAGATPLQGRHENTVWPFHSVGWQQNRATQSPSDDPRWPVLCSKTAAVARVSIRSLSPPKVDAREEEERPRRHQRPERCWWELHSSRTALELRVNKGCLYWGIRNAWKCVDKYIYGWPYLELVVPIFTLDRSKFRTQESRIATHILYPFTTPRGMIMPRPIKYRW